MRILGLDYGEKRIGVAISDPLGVTAQPVSFVTNIEELEAVVKQYDGVEKIVVGLPRKMSGELGPQAAKVQKFVEELRQRFSQEIITRDERLTTVQAEKVMIEAGLSRKRRKQVIDKSAASCMLQGYLNSQCA